MEQKPVRFISVSTWLIIIVVINFLLFLFYLLASNLPFSAAAFWNYMETDVFKLVTGSLIIPLLFSILEKRYKFMENIQKQREEKQKENEQRRRNSRQEAISETIEMWQDLYNMASEVIYYQKSDNPKKSLQEIVMDMNRYSSTAEHIVNKWSEFKNLTNEDHDVYLFFINLLHLSSQSTAQYIQQEKDQKEIEKLQNLLYQIQDQIKTILNHTISNIFKESAMIMELEEMGENKSDIDRRKELIKVNTDILRDWRSAIKTLDKQHDNFLSTAGGPQVEKVRETANNIRAWLNENKDKLVADAPHFNDLQTQFYEIPLDERLAIIRIPFTKAYLRALADWLSLEAAIQYLYNQVHDRW